ncbi:MAG: phosphomannomutase/phosphoglucomutase [bacterium]|nr:phosphomannomutase/phosphoglucomutase [bacterium]
MFNPDIFRTYDIRGLADTELTDDVVYELGLAYGVYIKSKISNSKSKIKVGVGRDVRLSSDRISKTLIKGIIDSNLDVTDVGVVPTPVLYFSVFKYNYDGGIMITGSHNPKEYNGFKVLVGKETIYGDEIQNLRKCMEKLGNEKQEITLKGTLTNFSPVKDYIDLIKTKIDVKPKSKFIIDPGNGTCGPITMQIFKELGCDVEGINCVPDGNFPAHLPDPTVPKYMTQLVNRVRETKADLGIGYDGDGDRIGVVDELGNVIWGDKLLGVFAKYVLKDKPGSSIIFEVKCSQGLVEYIKSLGGNPVMWKAGHSLIKAKMKELNAPLAGEMSGHMFFAHNYYGYDDAIFASIKVLEILSKDKRPISEIVNEIPSYFSTPEIRVDSDDKTKFEVVEKLKNYFRGRYPIIDIDGVRIQFDDGFGLVRASNTQPVLVLRFEAQTEKRLNEMQAEVMGKLNELLKKA